MKIEDLSYVPEEYSEEAFLEFKKRILSYFDSHAVLYEKVSRKSAALKLEMFFQRNVFSGDKTYDDIVSYSVKNIILTPRLSECARLTEKSIDEIRGDLIAAAKGGSGAVLCGVVAGLLGLGMEECKAASLGVYVHGLAGEKAAETYEVHSVLAGELADRIGEVINETV